MLFSPAVPLALSGRHATRLTEASRQAKPSLLHWEAESVEVELQPFNDRARNRDVETLCAKQPRGSHAYWMDDACCGGVQGARLPHLDAQERAVA